MIGQFSKYGFCIALPIALDLLYLLFLPCIHHTSYYANHIIARYLEEGKRRKIRMATENLIINYFRAGFTYNEIADILSSRQETNTNIPTVVIHKVRSLIFRNFRPPPPPLLSCKCTYDFSPHPLPLSTSVRIKGYMTEIYFVNYYQRTTNYVTKERQYCNCYRQMSNQNIKKSPGIEGALLNCTGKMEMDYFGCLNSLLYFYFPTNPLKKINGVRTLTAQPPVLPQYEPGRF